MLNTVKLLLIFFLCAYLNIVLAQESVDETLLEDFTDTSEQSELLELIENLQSNPIDLNQENLEALKDLPGITSKIISNIRQYRERKGEFQSKEELLNIAGIDTTFFEQIKSFVRVQTTSSSQYPANFISLRSRVSDKISKPVGFKNGTYQNSSAKIYNRLQFELRNKINGGILLEKDSGENRLDDLSLFYLSIKFNSLLEVFAGNYQLQFGQGLVFWGPYGFTKSSDPIFPIKKNRREIHKYLSVDENASLFGMASTIKFNHFVLFTFISKNKLDATEISDSTIATVYASGFHRTITESSHKDQVEETVLGGRIQSTFQAFTFGITFYTNRFNKTFDDPDFERNRFKFRGDNNHVMGLDWQFTKNSYDFFGEFAKSKNNGSAFMNGFKMSFNSIQLAFLFRNYSANFQNSHSFGFGENNGATQNEMGFYTGVEYKFNTKISFSAYYDIFKTHWRSFFEPLPASGNDFLGQIRYKLNNKTSLTLRFRQKEKLRSEEFRDQMQLPIEEFINRQQKQYRIQVDYNLFNELKLRTRIDYTKICFDEFANSLTIKNENGILIYQDIKIQPAINLQISARLTFFESSSFDSRLFQYESDIPGVLTNRALFGRGNRWYLLLKYKLMQKAAIYLKYAETFRDDVDVIGTGADQILSNLDKTFGIQFEIKL